MTTIIATIISLSTLAVSLTAAWQKLRKILGPLLDRRRFKIAIVVSEHLDEDARAFAAVLRRGQFQDVDLTRDPTACLGRSAVVLWHPSATSVQSLVDSCRDATPTATVLVVSHERLPLRLSESLLATNSRMRLLGDLATLAEMEGARE